MKGSKPTAVVSPRRSELVAALRRYLDARRAQETQTALADEMTGEDPERLKALTVKSGTQRPNSLLRHTKRTVP